MTQRPTGEQRGGRQPPGVPFRIERVHDLDAAWPELEELFLAFADYNAGFLSRRLRPDWRQRWREQAGAKEDRLILLARYAGGEAAGYLRADIERDEGLFDEVYGRISDLFVRATRRDEGIGRALLKVAESWLRSRGVTDVRLDVHAANKPAVRFWTLSGYSLDGMSMKKEL